MSKSCRIVFPGKIRVEYDLGTIWVCFLQISKVSKLVAREVEMGMEYEISTVRIESVSVLRLQENQLHWNRIQTSISQLS